jgi:hypothetical protein
MRVAAVEYGAGSARILTTGGAFRFERGTIHASALLPDRREVARIDVGGAANWSVVASGDEAVDLVTDGVEASVREDSVVVLRARVATRVRITGLFTADYRAGKRGRWLVLDQTGGLGVYPVPARRSPIPAFDAAGWELRYDLRRGDALWVAVFPPRPPSALRRTQPIAHEGRPEPFPDGAYPGPDLVAEAADHCKVFALHAYFWKAAPARLRPRFGRHAGRRCPWLSERHEPECPERFEELARQVHAAGMRLVVYLSPLRANVADLGAEIRRILHEYPVDGLYLDGVAGDLPTLRATVRDVRTALGPDRILYLNATDEPFGTPRVYCPSVDAYADFVLRGDAGRGGLSRDEFLRWCVTGDHISNAVGHWCHYGSSGRLLPVERVPGDDDIDAALRHGVRLWRRSIWERGVGELARFDDRYYGGLAGL